MIAPARLIGWTLGAGALLGAAWFGYDRVYAQPRDELVADINRYQRSIADAREEMIAHEKTLGRLDAVAARSFGADRESADHNFRRALNAIGLAAGVEELVVSTQGARAVGTPARLQLRGTSLEREAAKEPDFVEIEGRLSGRGTLEQIMQLVHGVESAPWMKHVDMVKVDPRDNGEQFDVALRVRTLFLPGRGPETTPVMTDAAPAPDRYAARLARNPFRVPPPPPAPAPPVAQTPTAVAPPPAPGFPYDQWRVTGVADMQGVLELWLRHGRTGERRVLSVGDRIGDVIFLGRADGDGARVEFEGRPFTVQLGQSLRDRRPASQ